MPSSGSVKSGNPQGPPSFIHIFFKENRRSEVGSFLNLAQFEIYDDELSTWVRVIWKVNRGPSSGTKE